MTLQWEGDAGAPGDGREARYVLRALRSGELANAALRLAIRTPEDIRNRTAGVWTWASGAGGQAPLELRFGWAPRVFFAASARCGAPLDEGAGAAVATASAASRELFACIADMPSGAEAT
jgi:hypothetical protein